MGLTGGIATGKSTVSQYLRQKVCRVISRLLTPQGFEIVGVSEYGSRDDVKAFFGPAGAPYPVVSESESREDREKTAHFGYRQSTGDTRKWGSPWNIFLEPAKCSSGDVLTEKAWIVNGELIEADADKFIHDRLAANAVITPCKQ